MGVTNRLVYNTTDANTRAAGATIGSVFLTGIDATPIGHETLNALDWFRVTGPIIDSAGNEVAVTGNALDVNVASGTITVSESDVYAEDSAHTTGEDGTFILSVRADDLSAIPASILADTEGDYQALITGPNGELFVGGQNPDGSIDVVQAGCATVENTATAVSLIAVNVVTTALANRKELRLANEGNKSLYYGKTGVTAITGFPLHPGQQACLCAGDALAIQAIGGAGAAAEDMRVMEFAS